jgi:predicted RNA-binding Zn ribbon-like protein
MILTALQPGVRDDVALAVDLANTWETLDPPNERLRDVETLRRVLRHHGHDAAAGAAREADVPHVRALRDRLREAFVAPDEAAAVERLNAVLGDAPAPRLVRGGRAWRFSWDEATPAFLAPATATALLDAIRSDGFGRFGTCAGTPCTGVFVDGSRNRSRRYCCELCADRVAQARSRSRRRASPAPEAGR